MSKKWIDINCDMGESFGNYTIGNDNEIFPHITSCNVACGFHAGDPIHIENTIKSALKHNVRVGAHPGYPDLAGFGRRKMNIPFNELVSIVKYQIAALKSLTESHGGNLDYVKPHGALYNSAAKSKNESKAIVNAILNLDPELKFMGLAGSVMETVAKELGVEFIPEAFADRKYGEDGFLLPRSVPGSVINDADEAASQVLIIVNDRKLVTITGTIKEVNAKSICIHGDNPSAVSILKRISEMFDVHGITKGSKSE
jgi:UPF0271 protein